MFTMLSSLPRGPQHRAPAVQPCPLSPGEKRGGHLPPDKALRGLDLKSVLLSPARGSWISILNQRNGRLCRVETVCPGPYTSELVELGLELRAVSSKAIALGAKGRLEGSHNPVRSLKNCGGREGGILWLDPLSQLEAWKKTRLPACFSGLNN